MDLQFRDFFLAQWARFFGSAELPFTFYYSDQPGDALQMPKSVGRSCLICELARVRKGESLCYNAESVSCMGGKRYSGYNSEMRPTFRYFLSCGIEGKERGERYKISPEVVDESLKILKLLPTANRNLIFKRWDKLTESDNPDVVIFFAQGEALSGLFTLANFDRIDPNGGVIAPFGPGCGSIIHYPYLEKDSDNPHCVLGMFDPSARPCVPENSLSFAMPYKRFVQIANYMDESFLITPTWDKVMRRILK
jgi:hypothetical protein